MLEVPTGTTGPSDAEESELPVSVVIASLGGPTLMDTIAHLNAHQCRPAEILVCVPADAWGQRPRSFAPNVRVVTVPFRGQVRQRAAGFQEASQPYVLQLDDDLEFSVSELSALRKVLDDVGPLSSVGPVLVKNASGDPFSPFLTGASGFLASLVATTAHGARWGPARMGTMAPTGRNYGVDPRVMSEGRMQVDWLPGGCILHRRDDVVLMDYFPLSGKAYGEDLIHSVILREQGVTLWVTSNASCIVKPDSSVIRLRARFQRLVAIRYVNHRAGVPFALRAWGLILAGTAACSAHVIRNLLRIGHR